jgi:FMN-dependent NADH-azoreductase
LKSADIVVVALPMYNFSMPAIVKACFDSVLQKGVTFGGEYSQWWKKALTLISSGGVHSNKSFPGREHAISLSNLEFQYMGYSDVPASLLKELACYSYRRNLKKKRQDTATKKRTNYSRCRDIPRDSQFYIEFVMHKK